MKYNHRYTFRADIIGLKVNSEYAASIDEELYKPVITLADVYCRDPNGQFQFAALSVELNYGKQLAKLGQLVKGETIQFKARTVSPWKDSLEEDLRNPSKFSIVKSLTNKRYPVPLSEKLRVGYIMEVNGITEQPYSPDLVRRYDDWCDNYGYKKDFAADQSNAKSSTTPNQNGCYRYYTPDSSEEGV